MTEPPDKWICELLVSELPASGKTFKLEPTEVVCSVIAKRIDVNAVEAFKGALTVKPLKDGLMIEGDLTARLLRTCVASLEPMHEDVSDQFSIRFSKDLGAPNEDEELGLEDLAVEPLESDRLDLADLLVQHLALAMAPYPRKADGDSLIQAHGEEVLSSPFAVLQSIGNKPPKGLN